MIDSFVSRESVYLVGKLLKAQTKEPFMNLNNSIVNVLKSFKQQAIGVVNIGLMVGAFYFLFPTHFVTLMGKVLISLFIGFYLYFISKKADTNKIAGLLFTPTGEHKDHFEELIRTCDMKPENLKLRYSYTDTGIAMAAYAAVCIDPMMWNGLESDPQAHKAVEAIEQYVMPAVPLYAKERIHKFKSMLTPAVQDFIFKHELGHIAHNYSSKKLLLTGAIGALATFLGITAALSSILLGYGAFFVGLLVGGVADVVLSYVSNLFFKLQEEKAADKFAVDYSSRNDIQAAARFFEAHQTVVDTHREEDNILQMLPSALISGHQNGKDRARYLRGLIGVKS
jgi:hypothetical protein